MCSDNSKLYFQSEQISAIHEAFSYFDNNNDGLICKTEFVKILTCFGEFVTESEIINKIREWDEDGDGFINFAEFIGAMTQILTDTENEERMREAFRFFDRDNNGFITSCELAQMMEDLGQRLTAEQVQEMIREADIDNDGKISFEEFRNVMKT